MDSKFFNRNFKCKVYGLGLNTLVGFAGFLRVCGSFDLAFRLFNRAISCSDDKCICKLRRGLKITFYYA